MAKYIATAIQMRTGYRYSDDLLEIDKIYLESQTDTNWYAKEAIHDWLKQNPGEVLVKDYSGPKVVPCISKYGEKYVRSEPNNTEKDNLLSLPRR